MKCYSCSSQALFFCPCSSINLCEHHLEVHLRVRGPHPFEQYLDPFSDDEKKSLKEELKSRIKLVQTTIKSIHTKVKNFITHIKNLERLTINKLNTQIDQYIKLLNSELFLSTEINEIQKIIDTNLQSKELAEIPADHSLKGFFFQDFFDEKENDEKIFKWRKREFLKFHNGSFRCAAILSDRKLLLTGGIDATVRVWDLEKRSLVCNMIGHLGTVHCVIVTGYSRLAVSGSDDRTIIIWSLRNFKKEATLIGQKGAVYSIAVTDNPSVIISAGFRCDHLIWDLKSKTIIGSISSSFSCLSIIYSKKKDTFFFDNFSDIEAWSFARKSNVSVMSKHLTPVNCLALTTSESFLLSGSNDTDIHIWDLQDFTYSSSLKGHTDSVLALSISQDDRFAISGSGDCTVRIWNLSLKTQLQVLKKHTDRIYSVLLFENQCISVSIDSTIIFWDLNSRAFIASLHQRRYTANSEFFTSNSLFVGYGSGIQAIVWNLEEQKEEFCLNQHVHAVQCVAISENMQFGISGSFGKESNLIFWYLKKSSEAVALTGHLDSVLCVSISSDNLMGVSGSADETVRLWDLTQMKQLFEFKGHSEQVYSVAFTLDCKFCVSAGFGENIMVWDICRKELNARLKTHFQPICKVIVSCDDQYALICNYQAGVEIWDFRNQNLEFVFKSLCEASDWLKMRKNEKELIRKYLF